jgi:hypothetical protein
MDRRLFLLGALAAIPAGKLFVTAKSGVRFKHESSRTSQKYLP